MRACSDDVDIAGLVYEAAGQVPRGMVTTYGDIAAALGDPVAARAVGEILSSNPTPIVVPCHRVVYSSGQTGWYAGHGKGKERKIELLRAEGVSIKDGKIEDLERVRFRDFKIPPMLERLRGEQDEVRDLVVDEDDFDGIDRVAGLDVSYSGSRAFSALVAYECGSGRMVGERTAESVVRFPYIPTYLSFRETPALRSLVSGTTRTLFLIDGQGVLHPRKAGIASHIGVCLDVPTVGAAKSLLIGEVTDPSSDRSPILLDGMVKGYKLGKGKQSTFISVGNRVSLETAVKVCSRFLERGIPAPLRRAHELANKARKEWEAAR